VKVQSIKHKGKGSQEEPLPSRHAMSQLTGGDPTQRSLNNYSKKSPASLDQETPNIFGVAHTFP
jgi:hypothetical protein